MVVSSQATTDGVVVDAAQVDAGRQGGGHDRRGPARHPSGHRVEERVVDHLDAASRAAPPPACRALPWTARGDASETLGAVVHGVHRGDHRQQHLRGADVAGRLLPADVLLAGLQGQPVRRVAVGVDRHADESPGQRALQPLPHGHVAGVRPAEAERHAEALRGADHDVGPDLARRAQQAQREQVGGHGHQTAPRRARPPPGRTGRARRPSTPAPARSTPNTSPSGSDTDPSGATTGRRPRRRGRAARPGCAPPRWSAGGSRRRRRTRRPPLPSTPGGRSVIASAAAVPSSSSEALAMAMPVRSATIVWKSSERLEPALGDLGLVRRVGRVPGRVLQHVAADDRRA